MKWMRNLISRIFGQASVTRPIAPSDVSLEDLARETVAIVQNFGAKTRRQYKQQMDAKHMKQRGEL